MESEHLELSHKQYSALEFTEKNFNRSSIDNCDLHDSRFQKCSFDRASLICLRADNCVFDSCQFQNVDLLSCRLSNCKFKACNFSLANICDNTFSDCEFEDVDFRGATLKENEFLSMKLIHISLRGSVTSLNNFRDTDIFDSEFGNCTVDYNILENCFFQHSIINVESFGAFYGLDPSSLQNTQFLSLGQPQEYTDIAVLIQTVRAEFERDHQYIYLFILELNTTKNSLLECTEHLCKDLRETVCSGNYIPSDQLTFLFNVFKEFYRKKQLGFLALCTFRNCIGDILNEISSGFKFYEKFVLLYNNLNLLYHLMISDLAEFQNWDYYSVDKRIIVRFKFKYKPAQAIVKVLEDCYQYVYDRSPEAPPILLAEQTGSYIVFIQTTVYTLLAFRLCTYLLVGSVKDIVKLRANMSLLVSKKLPRKYYLEVTKPESQVTIPQAIAALLTGLLKKALPAPLKNFPVKDFSSENLTEMVEVSKDDVPKSKNHH